MKLDSIMRKATYGLVACILLLLPLIASAGEAGKSKLAINKSGKIKDNENFSSDGITDPKKVLSQGQDAGKNKNDPWQQFDPCADDLEIEIVSEKTENGILIRNVYFTSHKIDGEPVRIFGIYATPKRAKGKLPGILFIHGGGQVASESRVKTMASKGYSAFSHDWKVTDPKKLHLVNKWPVDKEGKRKRVKYLDSASWISRRALTFLEKQPEVDKNKLGIFGFSWGGYFSWLINGTDKRVKVAVPCCGSNGVKDTSALWNTPDTYTETMSGPVLFLNGSNDFFGLMDRSQKIYDKIKVEKRLAISPNENHGLSRINYHKTMMKWFDHYLKDSPPLPPSPLMSTVKKKDSLDVSVTAPNALKATLFYSYGSDSVIDKCWLETPMKKRVENTFTVALPVYPGIETWYYVGCEYEGGIVLSSRHEILPANQAKGNRKVPKDNFLYDPAKDGASPLYLSWRSGVKRGDLLVSETDGHFGLSLIDTVTPERNCGFRAFLRIPSCPFRKSPAGATALAITLKSSPAKVELKAYQNGFFVIDEPNPFTATTKLEGGGKWTQVVIPLNAFKKKGKEGGEAEALSSFEQVKQFHISVLPNRRNLKRPEIGKIKWLVE